MVFKFCLMRIERPSSPLLCKSPSLLFLTFSGLFGARQLMAKSKKHDFVFGVVDAPSLPLLPTAVEREDPDNDSALSLPCCFS